MPNQSPKLCLVKSAQQSPLSQSLLCQPWGWFPSCSHLPWRCPSLSAACTAPRGLLLPPPGRGPPDGGAEEGCDGLHPQVWPPLLGSAPLAVAGTHDSRSVKHSLVASSRAAEQVWLPEAHPTRLGGPPWGKGRPGPQILLSIFFRFYTLVTN